MIKLLVFDKDGVLLNLTDTWLPVIEALANYTISRLPHGHGDITAADLLASINVDVVSGQIDPAGVFARDPSPRSNRFGKNICLLLCLISIQIEPIRQKLTR